MRTFGRNNKLQQWVRFALKTGLLLTDAKAWNAVNEQLRNRADDVRGVMREKYEETAERLQDARDAYRGRNYWLTPTASFLGGVGLGVGLGILFAPVSGEEARAALRGKAMDLKDKVTDFATSSTRYQSSGTMATGTDGD
jgi:hypothetical protein